MIETLINCNCGLKANILTTVADTKDGIKTVYRVFCQSCTRASNVHDTMTGAILEFNEKYQDEFPLLRSDFITN